MSAETIPTVTIDTDTSSRKSSSSENESCTESARDSLNSLIVENTDKKYAENCINVKCTVPNQCSMSSDENSKSGKRSICCNSTAQSVWGVLLFIMSISGLIFTPLDFMLWEKLNMRPGFPPYEWWADPPDEVKMRVYVFNVTNHDRFLQGLDEKINVEEIGPIVYLEKLLHSNIKLNENGTMSYTAKRFPIYLPDENSINMNDTLIVPNLALLGASSVLHDANYFMRTGFRMLANSQGTKFFSNKTIYEFLWDFTDPILHTTKNIFPAMVPVTNMGMLERIYYDFTDNVTVKMGPQWGHNNFFKIEKYDGKSTLGYYDPNTCPDRVIDSTEGVMYHQHMKKDDVLLYLRKTVCKVMRLYFDDELIVDGVPVYRYNLSENSFDRISNGTDCYEANPPLPSGLSDASKCYFDIPTVMSFPHYYTGSPAPDRYVTGFKPDQMRHKSYAIVEPNTGIPFRAVARMQSNFRIHDLSGFSSPDYMKFSNLILPMGWVEYSQEGLPTHIRWTIYFMVIILPPASTIFSILTLIFSIYLIAKQLHFMKFHVNLLSFLNKRKKIETIAKNNLFTFEKEAFLKNCS